MCECGNPTDGEQTTCDHCAAAAVLREQQTAPHDWQRGWLTGTLSCRDCGLMPLEDCDVWTDCPGGFVSDPVPDDDPDAWQLEQDRFDAAAYGP